MATLCITEVAELSFDPAGNIVLAPKMPPIAEQDIAIGATSVPSAAFSPGTRYVLVETDVACHLNWLDPPVAVAPRHRLAPNEVRFYGVTAGQKLAVIQGV